MKDKTIRAILMDGRDLLIAWPGMGEGTEAGTRELVARLESVREALVPGQDTSWSTLDARSREVARLGTDESTQRIRIPSDLRPQPTDTDKARDKACDKDSGPSTFHPPPSTLHPQP